MLTHFILGATVLVGGCSHTPNAPARAQLASITGQAQVALTGGQVTPLAFETVYLSTAPVHLLTADQQAALATDPNEMVERYMDRFIDRDDYDQGVDAWAAAMKAYAAGLASLRVPAIQQATTDATGSFSFHNVPAGQYWLVMNDQFSINYVGWSRPVLIRAGQKASVSLNNTNADYAFSVTPMNGQ